MPWKWASMIPSNPSIINPEVRLKSNQNIDIIIRYDQMKLNTNVNLLRRLNSTNKRFRLKDQINILRNN
ncbi:hypothetical protein DERF_009018 [Dermatophagoides farinae]|uniref:Uncharacterized protein n=1 Tax=Dermatophagoides farinae TaxID=6954 RepID=A0A922HVJ8_DERFA|nr:hypothetical protein DERF_009018 [Dermatophagoides farinae]